MKTAIVTLMLGAFAVSGVYAADTGRPAVFEPAKVVCCGPDGDVIVTGTDGGLQVTQDNGLAKIYRGYGSLEGWRIHVTPWILGRRNVTGSRGLERLNCTTTRNGISSCT